MHKMFNKFKFKTLQNKYCKTIQVSINKVNFFLHFWLFKKHIKYPPPPTTTTPLTVCH